MKQNSCLQTVQNCLQKLDIPLSQQKNQRIHQKKSLNSLLFVLNLIMMNCVVSTNIYLLFGDSKNLSIKCFTALGIACFCLINIAIVALILKVNILQFLRAIFIMDSISLSTVVTTVAFIGLMKYLDRNKWEMKIIQITFAAGILSTGVNLRILLLHMRWKYWQVITFKIGLYIIALTYFAIGVNCFYTKYSFTFNISKIFDQQCRYFVILYVFASFEFSCKLVKTMSNFDFTQKLKYSYSIKNVPLNQMQKIDQVEKLHNFLGLKNNLQNQKYNRSFCMIPVTIISKRHISSKNIRKSNNIIHKV